MISRVPHILHIITRLDAGGSATDTIVLVDKMRKYGFDTSLAVGQTHDPNGTITRELQNRDIKYCFIQDLVRNPSPLKDLRAMHQIKRLLASTHFDLVHTHSSKAGILGRVAAQSSGIPSVHTPHGHIFYGYFNRLLTGVYIQFERMAARRTKKIVSLTDLETEESLAHGIGKIDQYVTIHSGVPLDALRRLDRSARAKFRSEYGIPENAILIVSVARLTHIKGLDVLIKALADMNTCQEQWQLALVGDGEEKQQLARLAHNLRLETQIRFTGHLSDITPALAACDIFVLPSRNEGMGRALVEAMAAGLPCVATNVGGIPTIIKNNINGLIVPPDNPNALSKALIRLITLPSLRKQIGNKATESVYPEYDEETMLNQHAELYGSVIAAATDSRFAAVTSES
ncbi:MAG: glycosyltransferase family 4 protein [Lentisphaerae bacterium]|nr:glycosyltransferase family 4 protein [Lentisphaerota bacterium]